MQETKEILERLFNKKASIIGNKLKINVQSIDTTSFELLAGIYFDESVNDIELKRSGTGITILITFK